MAKSSKRQFNAAPQRRLSIERLETRTVLSATNLLAAASDFNPEFEDRFEIGNRSAFIASQFDVEVASAHGAFAIGDENQSQFTNGLELLQPDSNHWSAGRPENVEARKDWTNFPGLASGAGAMGDRLHRPVHSLQNITSLGDLVPPPDEFLVSIVEHSDVRLEFGTFDLPPQFTIFADAADRLARANPDSEVRSESSITDGFNEREQRLADRSGEGGFVDIGVDRSELGATNPDRLFAAVGDQIREGLRSSVPHGRPEQTLSRTTMIGDETTLHSEPEEAVAQTAEGSLQQLTGGLIELPAQSPSVLRAMSTGQQFDATSSGQNISLWRQTNSRRESASFEINASLDISTRGLATSLSAKRLADSSLANRVEQSDGGLVELDIGLADQHKAGRHAIGDVLSDEDSRWPEVLRHASESFWLEFGDDIGLRLAANGEHQLGHEVDEDDAETQLIEAITDGDGEEGGIIELIAMSRPNARQPSPQPANQSDSRRETPEKVRMDTGVGMFQAFEIATSPQSSTHEAELTANEVVPVVETTGVNEFDATAPAEQAAAISDNSDSAPIRAASLPALLAAVSLLFTHRQRSDDNLVDAQRRRR